MKNTIKRTITAICIALATIVSLLAPAATATAYSKLPAGYYDLKFGEFKVSEGKKATIELSKFQTGEPIPQKNYKKEKITFKSNNTKIATVNNKGVVTGKKVGKTTITISYKYGKDKIDVNVVKCYADHNISLRGQSLDLSKKYTESQIVALFGNYSRKSEKYYTGTIKNAKSVKSKTKNGYYISYTDDYKEFAMFEFVDNTLANIYTSANSFKSGNLEMSTTDGFTVVSNDLLYGRIYDTVGNGKGDLQFVLIRICDSYPEPFVGSAIDTNRYYKKGMKAPMDYTIPKDVYLMEMDFVNALRAKHAESRQLGYFQWSDKAMAACKEHVDYCWKHGEWAHVTSDRKSVSVRVAKLLGIEREDIQTYENLSVGNETPFTNVVGYYHSAGHRNQMLGNAKYFGMYDNGHSSTQCMFGEYSVDYSSGTAKVTEDFEVPELNQWYNDYMHSYTGAN